MPSPGLSTIIILSEIVFIETVLIIAFLVYFFLKSKNKSLKLNLLLKSLLDDEKNRLDTLSTTFNQPKSIDEEKYNTILKDIVTAENSFYKYLVTVFYHNDLKLLDSLSSEIQEITKSCAALLPEDEKPDTHEVASEPVVDVDDAMNELLSDDEEMGTDIENDPAFDLSNPDETVDETSTETPAETTSENNEIEEIPSDLLNDLTSLDDSETGPENVPEEDNSSENKPEK